MRYLWALFALNLSGCWVSFMGGAPVAVAGGTVPSTPSGNLCSESEDVHELRDGYPASCEVRCQRTAQGFQCAAQSFPSAGDAQTTISQVSPGLFQVSTAQHDIVWFQSDVVAGEEIRVRSEPRWIAAASQVTVTRETILFQPVDPNIAPSTVRYPNASRRSWLVGPQTLWIDQLGAVCGRDVFAIAPAGAYYLDVSRAPSSDVEICFGS